MLIIDNNNKIEKKFYETSQKNKAYTTFTI